MSVATAQLPLDVARDLLDRTLVALRGYGHLPAGGAATRQAALTCAHTAAIDEADPAQRDALVDTACRAIDALCRLLERAGEPLSELLSMAREAARALDDYRVAISDAVPEVIEPPPEPPPERFLASEGIPRTRRSHVVATPMLAPIEPPPEELELPSFDVPALFAEALALESGAEMMEQALAPLDAPQSPLVLLRPPTRAADPTTVGIAGERAQLRHLARSCLEIIGVMGNQRRVAADERWADMLAVCDQRLLAALDALMALGESCGSESSRGEGAQLDVAAETLAYANQALVPDPFRELARTLVLCCMAGQDKVRAAVIAFRQAPEESYRAHSDAFALGSSPHIDAALRGLCREQADAAQLYAVLRAMQLRQTQAPEVEPLLQHVDHRVRRAAVRCLVTSAPGRAAAAIERLLQREIEEDVVIAALQAQLFVSPQQALAAIAERIEAELLNPGALSRGALAPLARLLSVAGDEQHFELLCRLAVRARCGLIALGWFGHPDAIDLLLDALDEAPPRAAAAALALHRISGADLGDGDPYAPSSKASVWRAWLADHPFDDNSMRLRLGRPFTPTVSLDELSRWHVPQRVRQTLALEIALLLGEPPLNTSDWIARQQTECTRLASSASGYPSGAWWSPPQKP